MFSLNDPSRSPCRDTSNTCLTTMVFLKHGGFHITFSDLLNSKFRVTWLKPSNSTCWSWNLVQWLDYMCVSFPLFFRHRKSLKPFPCTDFRIISVRSLAEVFTPFTLFRTTLLFKLFIYLNRILGSNTAFSSVPFLIKLYVLCFFSPCLFFFLIDLCRSAHL